MYVTSTAQGSCICVNILNENDVGSVVRRGVLPCVYLRAITVVVSQRVYVLASVRVKICVSL